MNVPNATRRDAYRPLLGGYGRARDRSIAAGPVASLPSPPSRESYSFSVVGHLLLARSLRNDRLSPSSYPCALRIRCRTRARAHEWLYARQRATGVREPRGQGRGVAPWEPRKTFPAYHPSSTPLRPLQLGNTSTHGLRTRPNTRESVRSGTAAKEVWSRDEPRDRPVTSQRTILSTSFLLLLHPSALSFSPRNAPSVSPLSLPTLLIPTTQLRVYTYRGSNCVVGFFASSSARDYENRNRPKISTSYANESKRIDVDALPLSLLSLSLSSFSFLLVSSFVEKTRRTRRMMKGRDTLTGNDRSQQWTDSGRFDLPEIKENELSRVYDTYVRGVIFNSKSRL